MCFSSSGTSCAPSINYFQGLLHLGFLLLDSLKMTENQQLGDGEAGHSGKQRGFRAPGGRQARLREAPSASSPMPGLCPGLRSPAVSPPPDSVTWELFASHCSAPRSTYGECI